MLLSWEITYLKIPPAFKVSACLKSMWRKLHTSISVWRREKQSWGIQCISLVGHAGRNKGGFTGCGAPSTPYLSCTCYSYTYSFDWHRQEKGQSRGQAPTMPSLLHCPHLCEEGTKEFIAGESGTKYLSSECFLSSISKREKELCPYDNISLGKGAVEY